MKVLPRFYYCLQGKECISSDAGIEKKREKEQKKVLPHVEDRTLTVTPLCTANIVPVTVIESLINTRTLKKRCALAARTEVKQTQELYDRWANV